MNLAIVLICGAAIAVIWLATLQRIAFERGQAVEAALQSNSNLSIAFEQQVFRTLKAAEQVAAFVREHYLQTGPGIDLRKWVEDAVIREKMFTIISVVNAAGDVVVSSQEAVGVNYADREFFVAQRAARSEELFVNQPVLGRVSGRWLIPMSLRISTPDGGFGGVVVMSVDPGSFTDFYRKADLGLHGLLELVGLDGVVRGRKIGHVMSFGAEAAELEWFQRYPNAVEGGFVDGGYLDGVRRVVSYRGISGYPLMVAVGTSYAEELFQVEQRRFTYLSMASATSAVLVLLACLLMFFLQRERRAAYALQASEALFRATFHQAATGIAHIAPDGRILRMNEKFCRMLGYSAKELLQRTIWDLGEEESQDAVRQFLAHRLSEQSQVLSPEIEKPYRRKDGKLLWVCEALGVVRTPEGTPDFLVVVTQDITARKDLEMRLSHDAMHDALTGLPNRVMFMDRLQQALLSSERQGHSGAVLYIDLDGFKAVNDTRGHAAGDMLLQQVARRLEACVRGEDTVARLGGDEFGVVLARLAREEDCELVAQKVLNALATPFDMGDGAAHISGSIGCALFPDEGLDASLLISRADSAMYAAKQAGKNRFSREPLPSNWAG